MQSILYIDGFQELKIRPHVDGMLQWKWGECKKKKNNDWLVSELVDWRLDT